MIDEVIHMNIFGHVIEISSIQGALSDGSVYCRYLRQTYERETCDWILVYALGGKYRNHPKQAQVNPTLLN